MSNWDKFPLASQGDDGTFTINPDLRKAWQLGCQAITPIEPLPKREATRLRHRLYEARKIMQKAGDPLGAQCADTILRIIPSTTYPDQFCLLLEPTAILHRQAFRNAGILTDADEPPPLDD